MNTLAKLIADLSRDPDPTLRARAEELRAKLNTVLDVAYYNSLRKQSVARQGVSVPRSPFSVLP